MLEDTLDQLTEVTLNDRLPPNDRYSAARSRAQRGPRQLQYPSWAARYLAKTSLAPSRVNVSPKLKLTAERERVWGPLRLAYCVAQVCNADAPDHRRVAKDDWRAGEAVEESNSGAKKNRRDVDVDFVEEPSIQALLDGVGAVDADGLPGGGGFGLVHGAFDAVDHEVYSRVGSRPSGGDVVGKYECWSPS